MASVNWQKHSGGTSVKAQFRHCDLDERLKTNHSNMEIDSSLTHRNLSFGCFTRGYKSACAEYDNRVKDIDDHANLTRKPRKDRVTCVSWSIPCPANMPDDMASRWFSDVYGLLTGEYSDVLGASVHFDEVHEYVDAFTGENTKSRAHMHAFVLPVVEKDGVRRLNGKQFVKKEDYTKLNKSIQAMTEDKYPGYTFMTGVKHPGKYQSVEDSKAQSRRMEEKLHAEEERAKQGIEADKSNALQVIEGAKNDVLDMAISFDKKNAERESELNAREAKLDERESKMEEKEQFMQWSYPTKVGKQIPILRLFEMFRKELKKAENEKKQSLPKHSSAPKPVDYVQKAMVEAIKPVVNKAYEDAQENMKRRVLPTLDYSDENESDEYSY